MQAALRYPAPSSRGSSSHVTPRRRQHPGKRAPGSANRSSFKYVKIENTFFPRPRRGVSGVKRNTSPSRSEEKPVVMMLLLYFLGLVVLWLAVRWLRELRRVPDKGDKYVYVTGCDSGFGNLLARHLDTLGFRVIAGCYTEKGEDSLRKAASERLTTTHLDVTDSESVATVAAHIKTLVGEKGLWAVVNNAGVGVPSGPTDWLVIEDYRKMLAVNLLGVIDVSLSVIPLLKKARGRVVNVASVFGRISAFGGPYCVSKYGVESFNDTLRLNLAPFGVRVICIEPGFFKTNLTDIEGLKGHVRMLWERLPQDVRDDYGPDYLRTSLETINKSFTDLTDPDLMKVVGCMEHAVAAANPRYRYSPGWDAKLLWLPLSYMPTCIADTFFRIHNPKPGVSRRPL